MEANVLKKLTESLERGQTAALVTLTESTGSTPRKTGSIMAVWKDGSICGSIGGGAIEQQVIQKAVACINKQANANFEAALDEGSELGMVCGGSVRGFIKVFDAREKLLIVGGGHIGTALFQLAKQLKFFTVIFDDREEFANAERFPGVNEIRCGNIEENLRKYDIDERTYIVIATHGHVQDQSALKAATGRNAAYIGVIGSVRKTEQMMHNLMEIGVAKEELQKVYAPIGLNIASEQPEEIALAILSEILLVKNNGSPDHLRTVKKVNFD